MREFLDQAQFAGDFYWPDWAARAARLRSHAATLLHCECEEIALVPNTTFGINIVATCFPWQQFKSGSSVVVLENEFSSNLLPWLELRKQGIDVRVVPVDESGIVRLDAIRAKIDATTRLVSASWVGYASGYRLDLAKLCDMVHECGSQLFVDAIQGLGVFPCDVSSIPIDYLAADGHKWLLGPEGAGILFVRRSRLKELSPGMVGWGSIKASHHFQTSNMQIKEEASRYEGGSANHVGQIGLERSLSLLLDLGCHRSESPISGAVLETAELLENSLRKIGATVYRDETLAKQNSSHLSGIVSFSLPNRDPNLIRTELIRNKVLLSVRHGRLRAAVHAYNSAQDVERFSSLLFSLLSGSP
jgi:selenocysteine lyase/cysteine desulfurase